MVTNYRMKKFNIQIEQINKVQSPSPFSIDKTFLFLIYFPLAFCEQNFSNVTQRFCIFACYFNVLFIDTFYYNTPIYGEILFQSPQLTEKFCVNKTPFHFRRRAEAVLRHAARLSNAFSTACLSTPKNWFDTSI